jgi:hypothetical protein
MGIYESEEGQKIKPSLFFYFIISEVYKMTMRKGLGKGMGSGYRNILMAHDKRVHRDAGLGRKQPQRMPQMFGGKRKEIKEPRKMNGIMLSIPAPKGLGKNVNIKEYLQENLFEVCEDWVIRGQIPDFEYDKGRKKKKNKKSKGDVKKIVLSIPAPKELDYDIDMEDYLQENLFEVCEDWVIRGQIPDFEYR